MSVRPVATASAIVEHGASREQTAFRVPALSANATSAVHRPSGSHVSVGPQSAGAVHPVGAGALSLHCTGQSDPGPGAVLPHAFARMEVKTKLR
ncbi:MAG TPA: hypothetical protein VHT91_04330 [Kofleriaceae bacterium]|nr:hypothetical protein [Kofleriaceae bacterium]